MSIDKGQTIQFKSNFPLAGVAQSTQQFRDNFAVIQAAIENLQRIGSAPASVFSVGSSLDDLGRVSLTVGYGERGLVIPANVQAPVAGSLRFNDGIEFYTGTTWAMTGGVASFNGRSGTVMLQSSDITTALGFIPASSVSPSLTGIPVTTTPPPGSNDARIANTAFVATALAALMISPAFTGQPTAPTASQATNTDQIATTAFVRSAVNESLVSPIFSGTPRAPTPDLLSDSTQIATTAFVRALTADSSSTVSPNFTGIPTAPTAPAGTNTAQLATTAYVDGAISSLVGGAPDALNTLNELAAAIGNDSNLVTTLLGAMDDKVSRSGDTITGSLTFNRITGAGMVLNKSTDLDRNWQRWSQGGVWWQAGFRGAPHNWVLETTTTDGSVPADDAGWTPGLEVTRTGDLRIGIETAWHSGNLIPENFAGVEHSHHDATIGAAGFMSAVDKNRLDSLWDTRDEVTGGGFTVINTGGGQIIASGAEPQVTFTGEQGVSVDVVGGEVVFRYAATDDTHGDLGGASLHTNATPLISGFMSAADKTKLDALTDADATTTHRGYLTPVDKTKLDALRTNDASTTSSGYMSALDKTKLNGLVSTAATPAADGYMSALDKTKLDGLVATDATPSQRGYLTGADKAKLDALTTATATDSTLGYMSAADKAKLDGLTGTSGLTAAYSSFKVGATIAAASGSDQFNIAGIEGISVSLANDPDTLTIGLGFSDAVHGDRSGGTLHANAVAGGHAGFMSGADKAKLDSVAANAEVNQNAVSAIAIEADGTTIDLDAQTKQSKITFIQGAGISLQTNLAQDAVTVSTVASDTQHGFRSGGALHATAVSGGAAGFMSGADKAKLDAVAPDNYYPKSGGDLTGSVFIDLGDVVGGIDIKSGTSRPRASSFSLAQYMAGSAHVLNRENAALSLGANNNLFVHLAPNARVGIGTDTPEKELHVVGDSYVTGTMYGVSSATLWADVAERYASDASYEPGTVVVYGGDEEITLSTTPGDTRVAGVISTQPAYMLNCAAGTDETHPYVALVGRVPCRVEGRIRKGDLLTTGTIAGHAMRAENPTLGSIIGKAIEDHDGERGVIEIVVQRS